MMEVTRTSDGLAYLHLWREGDEYFTQKSDKFLKEWTNIMFVVVPQAPLDHVFYVDLSRESLDFPDNTFDYVMAFHVVTVVPDPIQMISEAKRVCKPGGSIVIVNHFTSDVPVLGSMTEALDPLTRKLGWRTNLRLKPFIEAADLSVQRAYKLSKTSLYTVVLGSKSRNGRRFTNGTAVKNTHH